MRRGAFSARRSDEPLGEGSPKMSRASEGACGPAGLERLHPCRTTSGTAGAWVAGGTRQVGIGKLPGARSAPRRASAWSRRPRKGHRAPGPAPPGSGALLERASRVSLPMILKGGMSLASALASPPEVELAQRRQGAGLEAPRALEPSASRRRPCAKGGLEGRHRGRPPRAPTRGARPRGASPQLVAQGQQALDVASA